MTAVDPPVSLPRIPGFVVQDILGRGGMATVYRAHDPSTGREVAIKWLPILADSAARERFRREAHTAAALRHPHIVPVFSAGEAPGGSYIVMELVKGKDLAYLLDQKAIGRKPLLRLLAKVARALGAAHDAGVVHRDVKPANVLVDENLEPRIVDFGLARFVDGPAGPTRSGALLGTVAYMSPEVVEQGAASATAKSDVFSLACVLYEGLAGRPPFEDEVRVATLSRILECNPAPLPTTVSVKLARACLGALARDPAARPTTVELACALEAAADEPERLRRSRLPFLLIALLPIPMGAGALLALRDPPSGNVGDPIVAVDSGSIGAVRTDSSGRVASNTAPGKVPDPRDAAERELLAKAQRGDEKAREALALSVLGSPPKHRKVLAAVELVMTARDAIIEGRIERAREIVHQNRTPDEAPLSLNRKEGWVQLVPLYVDLLDDNEASARERLKIIVGQEGFPGRAARAAIAAFHRTPGYQATMDDVVKDSDAREADRLALRKVADLLAGRRATGR